MSEQNGRRPSSMEKRGGYSGGKHASQVGPPPKTPSASAVQDAAKKKSK